MSSTVFPLSSIIIFNIYLLLRDRKFTKLIIRNLLICAPFLIFTIFAINHVEEHEDLHAKGLFEFAQMLSEILAFPFGSKTILLNLLFLSIFNLPIFLYLWFFVSGRYDYKEIHNNNNNTIHKKVIKQKNTKEFIRNFNFFITILLTMILSNLKKKIGLHNYVF